MSECYFCGAKTNGKTFVGHDINGNPKMHPVCDNCDGPYLPKVYPNQSDIGETP